VRAFSPRKSGQVCDTISDMKGGRFYKRTLRDVPLRGKTVLVRVDYNVPLKDDHTIADDYRIRASLPTIRALLDESCKVVLISHLGRPDGHENTDYSLEPAAQRLAELIGMPVRFVDRCIGPKVAMAIKRAPKVGITMLENLRFHSEEEADDVAFARQLAKDSQADYFVQDGFGVVHRAHASTHAITQFLPSVAGLLLEREYMTITHAMREPERPLVAVLGGAKVSDKIGVLKSFVDIADTIILGGAMANTFLADQGRFMGASVYEEGQQEVIADIYQRAVRKVGRDRLDSFIVLPVDVGVGTSRSATATRQDVSVKAIPADTMALDDGPVSSAVIRKAIAGAKTVIWNGTLGMAEIPAFATGSAALAEALASQPHLTSIIGGGDTADFVLHWDKKKGGSFTHVSTGGGASLELMSGVKLPGIDALLDAPH
jgi:phosphoglycerate kinase